MTAKNTDLRRKQLKPAISFFFLITAVAAIIGYLAGCESDGSVGINLIDPPVSFTITDTLSAQTATVLMDSVITQGTGTILFGTYHDNYLGIVTASGYLKFSLGPGTFSPDILQARYDSLTLRMVANYHYGDTTQVQRIQIHRLLENIEPDIYGNQNVLYNFDSFDFESHPLADVSFQPGRGRVLEITMPEELGTILFESAKNEDELITNNERFQDFIKGLVIRSAGDAGTITGIRSDESGVFDENDDDAYSIMLRLYYTEVDPDGARVAYTYDFPVVPNASFNHISSKKPAPLNNLVQADDKISSEETNHQVYIQSGIGLMTRIDFDSASIENLHNIASTSYQILLSAKLVLVPVAGTYTTYTPLPGALSLYVSDSQNRIISEEQQTPAVVDHEFHKDTYYIFDITDFIENEMYTERYTGNGFLIATPSSIYNRKVDRIVLGDRNHQTYRMLITATFIVLN